MRISSLLPLVAAALLACGGSADRSAIVAVDSAPRGVIDSILPMEVLFERFRKDLPEVKEFGGRTASSPDSLLLQFAAALRRKDSVALDSMRLTRAEFAWLYYPHHIYAKPPYEMAPSTFWVLVTGNSDKGRKRLLDRATGEETQISSMRCEPGTSVSEPLVEAANCKVKLVLGGAPQELALFGSIVGRDGKYKFVSYANDF